MLKEKFFLNPLQPRQANKKGPIDIGPAIKNQLPSGSSFIEDVDYY